MVLRRLRDALVRQLMLLTIVLLIMVVLLLHRRRTGFTASTADAPYVRIRLPVRIDEGILRVCLRLVPRSLERRLGATRRTVRPNGRFLPLSTPRSAAGLLVLHRRVAKAPTGLWG